MTLLTLAAAETRLIVRNRTVLITAAFVPLAFAAVIAQIGPASATAGDTAAMELSFLQMFGLFMAMTMTLAARRQQRYLKRLRTSPASTASIVVGLATPLTAICALQCAVVFWALARLHSSAPERPGLLVVAFLSGAVTAAALGFLTASFTRNPEAAQFTVLPGMLVLMAGAFLAFAPLSGAAAVLRYAVPGAALTELARTAWDGGPLASAAVPLLVSTVVAAFAALIAARLFRWQPRT